MLKYNMMKLDKTVDGGNGEATKVPPSTEETKQTNTETTQTSGDTLDQYGYEKVSTEETQKESEETKTVNKEAEKKVDGDGEVKDPATGYGKDPVKVEETTPVKEEKKESEIKLEFEVDVKDLEVKEAEKLKKFVLDNKLTKEAAQALINLKKSEADEYKKAVEEYEIQEKKRITQLRASWDNELRTDPVFGGDKFAHNVMRAERVLSEFLGETKKALTEAKSMLPPYVMRDLAKLGDHLYGNAKLVQGDAKETKEEKEDNDPLDFYK